ncbi:hypothetical protein [Mycobacterium sp. 852002-51961_SCH5331710]|uniref:hypothetical protein n=1 Tax=Mycobacterium sp. 852002-51961_SCH5331710 TaxID=1834105 RepID=UPI0007FF9746|nr:hypothetical protein [Mycobacterium sp. 852002-51961_SCH5331710]OBB48411.1 hypothetical protein A5752_21345 [Mycobacterium sp. 852002-51961_SCH5331710]
MAEPWAYQHFIDGHRHILHACTDATNLPSRLNATYLSDTEYQEVQTAGGTGRHDQMMAATDKIAECVEHYKKLLQSRPRPPQSLSQAPDSQLHVIVKRAGAKRRSDTLLARLDEAFEKERIATYPRLTDPDLKSDDRVYILDAAKPIKGLAPMRELFRDETTLQEFIWKHHDWFPDLRRLGLHDFKQQAALGSGRRLDLLCKRRGSKQLVGIELKVREPDDRAVGQLQQYLDDLADHAQTNGYDSAHLIVITGQPDTSVRNRVEQYAARQGHEVTFLLYRVHMELTSHP